MHTLALRIGNFEYRAGSVSSAISVTSSILSNGTSGCEASDNVVLGILAFRALYNYIDWDIFEYFYLPK